MTAHGAVPQERLRPGGPPQGNIAGNAHRVRKIHRLVKRGDIAKVRDHLQRKPADVNSYDERGYTPLMCGVEGTKACVDLVRLLIECGADIHAVTKQSIPRPVVSVCLAGGDPKKLEVLIEHGVDLHYQRDGGYDALIDAAYGPDASLLERLHILLAHSIALNAVTTYNESGLRELSRRGRFDAVQVLLAAGADEAQLAWTPLIRAVVLGTLADVEREAKHASDLEATDYSARTAFLVAVQIGDIAKARLFRDFGANMDACSRGGKGAISYAIENQNQAMLRWLIDAGFDAERTSDSGKTPLMTAAEYHNAQAVELLLASGVDVNRANAYGETALAATESPDIANRLLEAGANPADLPSVARRAMLGFDSEDQDEAFLSVSAEDSQKGWARRLGTENPEEMDEPFWKAMIQCGTSAYQGGVWFGRQDGQSPVWCTQRFGQTFNRLPDGRIIQIAGEHEDSYDEGFCIYSDVFVHTPNGEIQIFGYPEAVFPPADFHTATLVGEYLYIVGSLGYYGQGIFGVTPV